MAGSKKIENFNLGLELCEQYIKDFGDLKPKRTYVTDDGYPFGRWILYQREKYNKDKLTEEQIKALEDLGMVWSTENHGGGYSFNQKFEMYKNQLGSNDAKIKEFAQDLRSAKRNKGPYAGLLTDEMVDELLGLGFIFDLNEAAWDAMYYSILSVYDKIGFVNNEYLTTQQSTWIKHQKEKFYKLSDNRQRLLSEIGIGPNAMLEQWNNNFKCAREYYIQNEHLLVPYGLVVGNVRLGEWISRQRKRYTEKTIEQYQVEKLEEIGMVWDVSYTTWMNKYNVAKKYYELYGTLDVPALFEFENIQLGTWIYNQKQAYWSNTLDSDKKILLDKIGINWEHKFGMNTSIREKIVAFYLMQLFEDIEFSYHAAWLGQKEIDIFIPSLSLGIEYDGARWHSDIAKDLEKDLLCKKNEVNLIRIREPGLSKYSSQSLKLELADLTNKSLCHTIVQIVSMINLFYKTDYSIDMCFEKDYPSIVGLFSNSQHLSKWMEMYSVAKRYFIENGNLLVPQKMIYCEKRLGTWIYLQRQALKPDTKYIISPKQIEMLNEIGMVWDVYDLQFNENYELAKKLYERNGKLVLNKHAGGEIAKVANWEYYTRRLKQDGKLSEDKLLKYNEIEALIKKDEDQ